MGRPRGGVHVIGIDGRSRVKRRHPWATKGLLHRRDGGNDWFFIRKLTKRGIVTRRCPDRSLEFRSNGRIGDNRGTRRDDGFLGSGSPNRSLNSCSRRHRHHRSFGRFRSREVKLECGWRALRSSHGRFPWRRSGISVRIEIIAAKSAATKSELARLVSSIHRPTPEPGSGSTSKSGSGSASKRETWLLLLNLDRERLR